MSKPLRVHWFLQEQVRRIVNAEGPGLPIIVVVQHDDEQIEWDHECEGLGRVRWTCGYIIPPDHPARAFVPLLDAAIAPLQARYDLSLTSERGHGNR